MDMPELKIVPSTPELPELPTPAQIADKAKATMRALEEGADQVAAIRAYLKSYTTDIDTIAEGLERDLRKRAAEFAGVIERFGELGDKHVQALREQANELNGAKLYETAS